MKERKESQAAWQWILQCCGKRMTGIVLLAGLQVVSAVCSVGTAWALRGLIDHAVKQEREAFLRYALFLLLIIGMFVVCRAVFRHVMESVKASLENTFKQRLFVGIMSGAYERVSMIHSGEWMNRLTSDTVVVAEGMTGIFPEILGLCVRLVCAIIYLAILIPKSMWIVIPGGIAMVGLSFLLRGKMKSFHKKIQETDGDLRVFLTEYIENLLIVHSFGQEENAEKQSENYMKGHRKARMDRMWISNICNTGLSVIMNGGYAISAIYCGFLILQGKITYGTFVAVIRLVGQIQSPFANISGYVPKYYAMLASAERLKEVEEWKAEEMEIQTQESEQSTFEKLSLSHVSFVYRDRLEEGKMEDKALRDISFDIRRGDQIAITGLSGSGKSTLLKVLMGLYSISDGTRLLTLVNAETEEAMEREMVEADRSLFAYVPQGNQLMSGSIREIVAFGDRECMLDEDGIREALRIACILDKVSEMEEGLDTRLGEKGKGLSEGQIQRIAIARAIFSGHPILLLDEATASLDEMTERKLLDNLKELPDKTVILVTHRPTALTYCQRQIVIENGTIRT